MVFFKGLLTFGNLVLGLFNKAFRGIERSQDKKAGANEVKVKQYEARDKVSKEAAKTRRENPTPDNNDDLLGGL